MNMILMESISEVQQIVAECNTELIVIEASDSSEDKKESEKKSTVAEKIKKAWTALKNFVTKWWNAFIAMIKKNKAVILNGKKEVEYKDFKDTVKRVTEAIKTTKETGKHQGSISHQATVKGTVKEAVQSLEKCAAELKKAIDSAKPEKGEQQIEDVSKVISFAQSVLTQIHEELKRVVSVAGGKSEGEEATEEAFVSVLDSCDSEDCEDEECAEDEEAEVEEGFMAEAANIFYENVTMLEHQDFVDNALEVFEIMAECEVMMEADEDSEKKKSSIGEKLKKAWASFMAFFKKWWFKFVTFIKGVKRHISEKISGKTTKVDYKDYTGVIHIYTSDYMKRMSGKNSESASKLKEMADRQVVVKTASVDKALAALEKQGKEVSDLIHKLDSKMEATLKTDHRISLGDMISSLQALLNKIQTETSGVSRAAGFKADFGKKEKK